MSVIPALTPVTTQRERKGDLEAPRPAHFEIYSAAGETTRETCFNKEGKNKLPKLFLDLQIHTTAQMHPDSHSHTCTHTPPIHTFFKIISTIHQATV